MFHCGPQASFEDVDRFDMMARSQKGAYMRGFVSGVNELGERLTVILLRPAVLLVCSGGLLKLCDKEGCARSS